MPALSSFQVRPATSDQKLALSWSEDPGHATYTILHLELFQVIDGDPVKTGATNIGNTVESNTTSIPVHPGTWVVRATPENRTGFGRAVTSARVKVTNACPTATVCATVSSLADVSTVRLVGQGFLLGLTDWSGKLNNADRVKALAPRQWRFSGPVSDPAAKGLDVSRMQILSNLWNSWTAPGNNGNALTPWSDWDRWKSFVRTTVVRGEAAGLVARLLGRVERAQRNLLPALQPGRPGDDHRRPLAQDLRSRQPRDQGRGSAKPGSSGRASSALQWAPGAPAEFDLDTFLAHSAEDGVTWDAISWHENQTAPLPGLIASSVTNVNRHLVMARAVLARHPGTVVRNRIFVNEYGPPDVHMLAGWAVGYFRAFEDGGVSQANRACWTEAECTSQLGGLVTPNGNTTAVVVGPPGLCRASPRAGA